MAEKQSIGRLYAFLYQAGVLRMPVISKRKLESYKRAEKVAQEARRQSVHQCKNDPNLLCDFVIHWMNVTGKVKYEIPTPPPSRFKFQ